MTKKNQSHGFLYHPESQKILLHQDATDPETTWTLLESLNGKNFQETIVELLKFKLKESVIYPIYDYVAKGKKRCIYYAEVKSLKDFLATQNSRFSWFTQKEILKLKLSSQTKQDLIVGQRVINSQVRKISGEQTIG